MDAAINEVQRHCSMVSMGVFRYTTNDVQLEGYDIPKVRESYYFIYEACSDIEMVYKGKSKTYLSSYEREYINIFV